MFLNPALTLPRKLFLRPNNFNNDGVIILKVLGRPGPHYSKSLPVKKCIVFRNGVCFCSLAQALALGQSPSLSLSLSVCLPLCLTMSFLLSQHHWHSRCLCCSSARHLKSPKNQNASEDDRHYMLICPTGLDTKDKVGKNNSYKINKNPEGWMSHLSRVTDDQSSQTEIHRSLMNGKASNGEFFSSTPLN